MERLKAAIVDTYGSGGIFSEGFWKADSDRLFGPTEAVKVWELLSDAGLIPSIDSNLVFVSPTANIPTHEIAIWKDDSRTRGGSSLFLCGDILSLKPNQLVKQASFPGSVEHRFCYFRWDAEALPLRPGSVDVILDRKGWIWHCAKDSKNKLRLAEAFKSYHGLLKKNGCLVLDNNQDVAYLRLSILNTTNIRRLMGGILAEFRIRPRPRPSELYPGTLVSQYEASTVDVVDGRDPQIWTDLQKLFSIQDIGSGSLKTRVLIRK